MEDKAKEIWDKYYIVLGAPEVRQLEQLFCYAVLCEGTDVAARVLKRVVEGREELKAAAADKSAKNCSGEDAPTNSASTQ